MSALETRARQRLAKHRTFHSTECDLDLAADWPYDCIAKDKHPDHVVIVCRNHMIWDHLSPDAK